jgi:hypothetical protein
MEDTALTRFFVVSTLFRPDFLCAIDPHRPSYVPSDISYGANVGGADMLT